MFGIKWNIPTTNNYSTVIVKDVSEFPTDDGPIEKLLFYSSDTFKGAREGFVFTTGRQGTGYYIEDYENIRLNLQI